MSPYVVLARRCRPLTFEDLVGQNHVTRALTHALESGRVPHAFLFSGIRGVGKTTLARLLAMCLNCKTGITAKPCGQCASCKEVIAGNHPDVFEVDAASRTKVEQMREILDMVDYAPTSSPHKVYILDEVHMLSNQSFNALLKTLEEPPSHVKFIFATTESGKIPATILSRCQRYDLKRVANDLLTGHLTAILEREKTPFDAPGLAAVVRAAEGSVRDALSLLDQAISHGAGEVKYEDVQNLLGLTDQESILSLLKCLLSGQGAEALQGANNFYVHGVEPEGVVKELLNAIHQATRMRLLGKQTGESWQDTLETAVGDCSLEHLNMVYQVLLRGREDLRIAEDSLQALEMLLLRVSYLKPVPNLEKLLASVGSGTPTPPPQSTPPVSTTRQGNSSGNSTTLSAPTNLSKSAPPSHRQMDSHWQNPAKNSQSESNNHRQRLTSWEQLVSSATNSDVGLGVKLRTQLSCLAFHIAPAAYGDAGGDQEQTDAKKRQPSKIALKLVKDLLGTPEYYQTLVSQYLESLGLQGVAVSVEAISEMARPKTIAETEKSLQDNQQRELREKVSSHPMLKQLVERFQAELIRVEPIGSKIGHSTH